MSLQDIDKSFQFGEDPPWDDEPPEIDREKANAELESKQRILHPTSGLYCEHGHGPYKKETYIFLSNEDNVPIQICKSALEVAAFLGGYSKAVSEYLPVIISAVSLAPKNGPAYKLLNDFIYRNKSCYSVVPEPELEQDSSKINETGQNMSGACGIFDGKNPEPIKPFDHIVSNTWTCRFCGGTFADRTLAIKHAIDCDDNEDVHSCATCASYEIGEDTRDGYRHICKGNPKRIDTWMKHCPEWIGA